MNASNRLKILEDRLGVGTCPRCRNLPQFEIRMPSDPTEDAGDGICPDCGKPEPERLVIVFRTREDGPQ